MSGCLNPQEAGMASHGISMGLQRWMRNASKAFMFRLRREEGVSAIEFALISPLLAAGILFLGLVGLQINHHIKIDQILRAGAVAAANDPGGSAVLQRMTEVASAKGYDAINVGEGGNTPGVLILTSARMCFCYTETEGTNCGAVCPDQRPAVVQYRTTAVYREPLAARFLEALSQVIQGFGLEVDDISLRAQVMVR